MGASTPLGDAAHLEQGTSAIKAPALGFARRDPVPPVTPWGCTRTMELVQIPSAFLGPRRQEGEAASCAAPCTGLAAWQEVSAGSPRPDAGNVPRIRAEMYSSCCQPPANPYRWFCFPLQSSGKGTCPPPGGHQQVGAKTHPNVHLGSPSGLSWLPPPLYYPRRVYPGRFCLSILQNSVAHHFANYPEFFFSPFLLPAHGTDVALMPRLCRKRFGLRTSFFFSNPQYLLRHYLQAGAARHFITYLQSDSHR